MKFPGIFQLTKREQRAAIVIVFVLLAAAMAKHYREERWQRRSVAPRPAEMTATPSFEPLKNESAEGDQSSH
ncbi:MAG: hypothetical protein ACREIW_01015 [Chthoniobacterales bacterium]